MPLTFIDIERRTSWRILFFFVVLMAIYGLTCLALVVPFSPQVFVRCGSSTVAPAWPAVLAFGGIVSMLHILLAGYDSTARVVRKLAAQAPDPDDSIHRTLLNIMDEIHVVTGRKKKINCVVIPSLSLNALAACDLKGRAVIGITEGLLSRLNRYQLETVIAHEAHHILSGDCLETTIAANLFAEASSLLDKYGGASRGGLVHPALWPVWLLVKLGHSLNLLISREREYRADAAAVRMTRDPMALAEALHLLSRSWRGAGYIGSGFEMICIVNPEATALDETEGFWADLVSTHPPIEKRINLLLKMAHADSRALEPATRSETVQDIAARYYAMNPRRQWHGPFTVNELSKLPWLSPLTWIRPGAEHLVDRAWKTEGINAIFAARLFSGEEHSSELHCPSCRQPLDSESYEGTRIFCCRFCDGCLVESGKIPRILARTGRERLCTERVRALGRAVMSENQAQIARKHMRHQTGPLLACSKCGNPMSRVFFSAAYLIEVDRCLSCGLTWFDEDELAMLQCVIEAAHELKGAAEQARGGLRI